jgi:hypothetical protein
MAQIRLPEQPREREQLQSSMSAPNSVLSPKYEERPSRRFGLIGLMTILVLVAAFPHSTGGLELVSVLLIFASQVWKRTFRLYHAFIEDRGMFRQDVEDAQEGV